jgi:hypothetical protein
MRTVLVSGLILLAACSGGSTSTIPPVIPPTQAQPPPGSKPIPWQIQSESNDGYTIVVRFKAPECEVVKPTVLQTATLTKVTLMPATGCSGKPVERTRRVLLQDHYFPCTSRLIDGGTGKPAPVAHGSRLPNYCPMQTAS